MLTFKKVELEHKGLIVPYYQEKNIPSAKYSFANTFVWRNIYNLEFCEHKNFLYFKTSYYKNKPTFMLPIGKGDLEKALSFLQDYCKAEQVSLRIYGIYEKDKESVIQIFGNNANLILQPDESDYIYKRENLEKLSGKKYHGKRNHIARFKDKEWHYEAITEENIPACIKMHRQWISSNNICLTDIPVLEETCASYQAFRYFHDLDLEGGILYQEDQIVGYTMGKPLTKDAFVVHFEKAFAEIQGAYPTINQEFVLHNMQEYDYVNREEDTGDEGLRKAKMSYHPAFLLDEYVLQMDLECI